MFEVDVVMSQREGRAAANVPRPTSGRQYAGFFYFHEVLIPKLQTENQTFYLATVYNFCFWILFVVEFVYNYLHVVKCVSDCVLFC